MFLTTNITKANCVLNNQIGSFSEVFDYIKTSPLVFHNDLRKLVLESGFDSISKTYRFK